jgi:hypothetical protein
MAPRLGTLGNSYGVRPAAVLLVVIGLIACGDSEATQRRAFIQFLQTRIIAKPGIHVPKLTAEETVALGEYAKHYAVIADFNGKLDQAVSQPLQRALEAGAPRSLDDLVARRSDIAAVSAGFTQVRAALDRELAAADADAGGRAAAPTFAACGLLRSATPAMARRTC